MEGNISVFIIHFQRCSRLGFGCSITAPVCLFRPGSVLIKMPLRPSVQGESLHLSVCGVCVRACVSRLHTAVDACKCPVPRG